MYLNLNCHETFNDNQITDVLYSSLTYIAYTFAYTCHEGI